MNTMKLYYFPMSPNSRKVLALLKLVGVEPELVSVELPKGAQRAPEYLAVNPNGKVPTLVDGDFVLWESNAICQYLAARHGGDLYPADERVRADIGRWLCWQLSTWAGPCGAVTAERFYKRLSNKAPDEARLAESLQQFLDAGRVLDAAIGKRDFVVGNTLTIADLALAGSLTYARQAELPLAELPNVSRWFAGIERMDAWRSTAPKVG